MEFTKLIPILLMTLAMIIVSFMPIKKNKKRMVVIVTFVLCLTTLGISWVAYWS